MEKHLLAADVEAGMSIREIAQKHSMGATTVRHYLKKYQLKTHGVTFGTKKWTDQQLIEAVQTSITYSEVIRKLGLSATAAGNFKTVQNHIRRLQLDTSHFLGKGWTSNLNKGKVLRKPLEEILVENSNYSSGNLRKRLILEGVKEAKCERCKLTEWEGEPITLELDHINGNNKDHRLENLQILCPNCHALTPTWRGRNVKKKT